MGLNVDFIYHNMPKDDMVLTEKKRFQQVLINLYSNALKFTKKGGIIKVKVTYV